MRARHFRPRFDSLDSRLLLSGTDGGVASGSQVVVAGFSDRANDEPPFFAAGEWLLPDTPPDDPYDPTTPTQGGVD